MASKILDANWHGYVDLGLPSGNLWAEYYVGAEKDIDLGLLFMWGIPKGFETGKTTPISELNWARSRQITELNRTGSSYATKLDIIKQNMGGSWVLPSHNDFYELRRFLVFYGIRNNRAVFRSACNGRLISFPLSGYADATHVPMIGGTAYLWGAYNGGQFTTLAISRNGNISISSYSGYCGQSIRGVLHAGKDFHVIRKGITHRQYEERTSANKTFYS